MTNAHPEAEVARAGGELHSARADAFAYDLVASFSVNPTGAHFFRAQHERLSRLMTAIIDELQSEMFGAEREQRATQASLGLATRIRLSELAALFAAHQTFEDEMLRRTFASDTRSKMVHEQLEREMVTLMAELNALLLRFPTPTAILSGADAFIPAAGSLFNRLREHLRAEERQLFVAFDRQTGASALEAAAA